MCGKRCVRCIDRNQHPFIIGPTLKDELMVGQDNITVASVAECIASGSDVDHFFDLFGQFIWLWFFKAWTKVLANQYLSARAKTAIPLRMLPEELLDWEEKPGSELRKANLQKLRKDTRELIREKKQEEEEQKETWKPERKGRHPKYGEGKIISEDEMMIELEFPGYGKKQFLKAFGEVEVLKGL